MYVPSHVLHHDYECRANSGSQWTLQCTSDTGVKLWWEVGCCATSILRWVPVSPVSPAACCCLCSCITDQNKALLAESALFSRAPGRCFAALEACLVFPLQVLSLSHRLCLWSPSSCWLHFLKCHAGNLQPHPWVAWQAAAIAASGAQAYRPPLAHPLGLCYGSVFVLGGRRISRYLAR